MMSKHAQVSNKQMMKMFFSIHQLDHLTSSHDR
jgi:hypothetical protein